MYFNIHPLKQGKLLALPQNFSDTPDAPKIIQAIGLNSKGDKFLHYTTTFSENQIVTIIQDYNFTEQDVLFPDWVVINSPCDFEGLLNPKTIMAQKIDNTNGHNIASVSNTVSVSNKELIY